MRRAISSLCAIAIGGCSFGFAGGGLPPGIHTVAVSPFDNDTADPTLTQQVMLSVKQAVESRLGLRAATPDRADAVVTGKLVRFDPDLPIAFGSTAGAVGTPNQVNVSRRQVELTVDIQVVERLTGRMLWDGRNQIVEGDYDPGREADGRRKAVELLVKKLIDGVHQNW